jgi:ribosome-associated toxin RatA of RatAB toxin-antitoxin module
MIQGDMDRMEGYWQFTAIDANHARFESKVDYDLNIPMVGPMVKGLVKKLMTENLQTTLNAIKRRAEELAA